MKNSSAAVLSRICIVALVFALATTGAFAQVQNGVFTGTVTDPSGAAVTGATVTIINVDTGLTVNSTTNSSGSYRSQELQVGNYKITVAATGFKKAEKASIKLDVGTISRLDFKLSVGKVEEVVEVTTEAAIVNTEDSKLSANVGANQIASLPLNGRNVYDLIQLAPGAVNVRGVDFENGAGTVVNGLREDFNGFLINGVSNKGLSGGTVNTPIEDTVQEFQLLTLNNSAQYGNSASSITNLVTKAGTNSFHGTGFYFMRNQNLDANSFFNNHAGNKKPGLNFKQFGATIGGPIIKDKLFFYGGVQFDRFLTSTPATLVAGESSQWRAAVIAAQPNSVAALLYNNFVPTNAGTASVTTNQFMGNDYSAYLCDGNNSAAIAARFASIFGVTAADNANLAAYAVANGVACSALPVTAAAAIRTQPFQYSDIVNLGLTQAQGNLFDGNEYTGRMDWNISANDRLFGQYNWSQNKDQYGPALFPSRGFLSPVTNHNPNFQISYTHVFSPNIVNELKAGYAANLQNISVAQGGVPQLAFDDGSLGFGAYNGYPQKFKENIYTYSDMVSMTKGKHSMKVGVDVRRNIENSEFNVARPSYYFFDQVYFAADAPYTVTAGVDPALSGAGGTPHLQSNIRHWRNVEFGGYFQDDWKITPRLTLNLGMRYDLFKRHNEENNLATTFIVGPGTDIVTQIRNANVPAGTIGTINGVSYDCTSAAAIARAVLAGVCGPGGFKAASNLGEGDHNNFGPRVGFAWDVFGTGKTSLRGGFGWSYEGTLYNPLSNSRWNPPNYSINTVPNNHVGEDNTGIYGPQSGGAPSFTGAPDPLNNQGPVGQAQAQGNIGGWAATNPNLALLTGIVFPSGLRDPYVYNGFLSVQHEIAPKLVVEVDWVGTYGHKLFRAQDINRNTGGRLPTGVCITTLDSLARNICSNGNATGRTDPNYGRLRLWSNSVSSNYEALQTSVKKALSHGIQFNLNYTWSHSLDAGSTWHSGATTSNGAAGGEGFTTDATAISADYGNSLFDIRHRVVFNYVWDLPSLKDKNNFVKYVFGNWSYNGIVSYQSGAHWSPFNGLSRRFTALAPGACTLATFDQTKCVTRGDFNLDAINNDRPNSTVTSFTPSTAQAADGWGNSGTLFSKPCLGCIGNLRRNQFVGPSFIGADMSLFKNVSITERVKMQFRWEVFNVFNKTNFTYYKNRTDRGSFGQANSTFNPRQMQFGLKFSF